jgi:hypothetical protein
MDLLPLKWTYLPLNYLINESSMYNEYIIILKINKKSNK